jgi:hypothetical protein
MKHNDIAEKMTSFQTVYSTSPPRITVYVLRVLTREDAINCISNSIPKTVVTPSLDRKRVTEQDTPSLAAETLVPYLLT